MGPLSKSFKKKEEWAEIIVLDQASNKNPRGYPGYVPSNVLTVIDEKYGLGKNQKVAVIKTNCCPAIQRSSKNPFFRTLLDWLLRTLSGIM